MTASSKTLVRTVDEYEWHISACAAALRATLERLPAGARAYVYSVPTRSATEPGYLAIAAEDSAMPDGARIVRPSDNSASTFQRWEGVPYSALYGILWHACRREPILSIPAAV